MRPIPARRRCFGVLLTVLVGALGCALPSVAGAAPSYVSMGDSYTSAPGVTPPSATAPPECGQSERNYPHLVAAALNLSLTDISCGGAKTENFTVAQFPPNQPAQFSALTPTTEVITTSMGGNDDNLFGTLVQGCTETDFGKPNKGAPCKAKYEAFVNEAFETDKAAQEQALVEMHELSPLAKVFVVGYPEITPMHGYCPTALPWTTGDLAWFHSKVQARGNASIKADAIAHGDIFVNTFAPSKGHNLCEPVGTRWIEPLFGSLTGVAVHPNATGEENDAFDVELAMLKHGVR